MIEFHILGGIDLRDAAGARLSAVLAHPKRTALLAYLAAAAPRGFHRRDTLLALFWPELDQEHARASLRKAVHHLRRALGEAVLVSDGDEELGLAPDALRCDAAEFERAADAGDAARAFDLYRGPLLEGFFVPDAPEFERWQEAQRARLRDRAFHLAWQSAERAERAGDGFDAAHWGRRAAALAPHDEGALRRLIALLDRLGDRAGAVSAYEDFARHLARDLDVEPSVETKAMVREIRAHAAEPAPPLAAVTPPWAELAPADRTELVVAPSAPARELAPPPAPLPPRPAGARRPAGLRRSRVTLLLLGVAVLAGGAAGVLRHGAAGARTAPPAATSVAVLPFVFRGGQEFAYLAEGMASLLGTSLDEVGGLQGVDPSVLLALTPPEARGPLGPAAAAALAARFGAGMYVVGDLVEAGGRLRASAALYDGRRGPRLVARATAEDTASQLFALVDRLAAQLTAGQRTGPGSRLTRLAALTTHSLPALKAYLEGEQRFRVGHYKEAVDAFQRAVGEDSTFALAYYRLAIAYGWASDTMQRPMALQAARHGRRLSPPDRLLVEALLPYVTGAADEAERRYRAILSTRPFEGEAWYPLGEVLFHYNPIRGRPIAESKPIFERALALGPRDAPLTHLLEVAAIERDYAAFDTLLRGISPGAHFDLVGRTVRAFTSGTEADRARVLAEARGSTDADLGNVAQHMLFLLDDRAAAERVVRLLLEPRRPREAQAIGRILLAHLALSGGRRRAAEAELRAAEPLDGTRALEHRALLATLPFAPAPRPLLEATAADLERWNAAAATAPALVFTGDQALHPQFRSYLLGLVRAALGDDEGARRAAADAERLPGTAATRALAAVLAHGVRARAAWERGRPGDALSELQRARLDRAGVDLLGVVPFHETPQERFLRGEVLDALGRGEEALPWYGTFGEHSPFGRVFLAPAHRRQGEILERLGRPAEAARHYARFAELWKDCDPELRPLVAEARARLAYLAQAARPR